MNIYAYKRQKNSSSIGFKQHLCVGVNIFPFPIPFLSNVKMGQSIVLTPSNEFTGIISVSLLYAVHYGHQNNIIQFS